MTSGLSRTLPVELRRQSGGLPLCSPSAMNCCSSAEAGVVTLVPSSPTATSISTGAKKNEDANEDAPAPDNPRHSHDRNEFHEFHSWGGAPMNNNDISKESLAACRSNSRPTAGTTTCGTTRRGSKLLNHPEKVSVLCTLFPFLNHKSKSKGATRVGSNERKQTYSCKSPSSLYKTVTVALPEKTANHPSNHSSSLALLPPKTRRVLKIALSTDASCTYYQQRTKTSSNAESKTTNRSVTFDSNVQTYEIPTLPALSCEQKSYFWWQQNDYMNFRKIFKIITKSSFQEGRDCWLSIQQEEDETQETSGDEIQEFRQTTTISPHDDCTSNDEWWHTIGHSRRGIEQFVSIRECRQRQSFATISIQAVLDEQLRQDITNDKDIDTLAQVSRKHTRWAKDLALATGAADEDALRSNFGSKAKSREEHLSILLNRIKSNIKDEDADHDDFYSAHFILDAYYSLKEDDEEDHTTSTTATIMTSSRSKGAYTTEVMSTQLTAEALEARDKEFRRKGMDLHSK